MANNLTSNPMIVTATFTATSVGSQNDGAYLDEIYWYNPSSSGDTFNLTLGDGNTVIRNGRCESSNQSQVFSQYGRRVTQLALQTISSGTIYIYWH